MQKTASSQKANLGDVNSATLFTVKPSDSVAAVFFSLAKINSEMGGGDGEREAHHLSYKFHMC